MRNRTTTIGVVTLILLMILSVSSEELIAQEYEIELEIEWIRQFGTDDSDTANSVSISPFAFMIAVGGITYGSFEGYTNLGDCDAFVSIYNNSGDVYWTDQFGTPESDIIYAVSVGLNDVFVAGSTMGTLPEEVSYGNGDAFVRLYNSTGEVMWTDQFGSSEGDSAYGTCFDPSGLYVAGFTWGRLDDQISYGGCDAFIRKYNIEGDVLWTRQFGTEEWDYAKGVSVEYDTVYVTGETEGAFPGHNFHGKTDGFIQKFSIDGLQSGNTQFPYLSANYIGGISGTTIAWTESFAQYTDGVVSFYNSDLEFEGEFAIWGSYEEYTQEPGPDTRAWVKANAIDEQVVTGTVWGELGHQVTHLLEGGDITDVYVIRFNSQTYKTTGYGAWELGTSGLDDGLGIAYESFTHETFVVGRTTGTYPDQNHLGGCYDAFIIKLIEKDYEPDWPRIPDDLPPCCLPIIVIILLVASVGVIYQFLYFRSKIKLMLKEQSKD